MKTTHAGPQPNGPVSTSLGPFPARAGRWHGSPPSEPSASPIAHRLDLPFRELIQGVLVAVLVAPQKPDGGIGVVVQQNPQCQ